MVTVTDARAQCASRPTRNGSSGFRAVQLTFLLSFMMVGRVAPLRAETASASPPPPPASAEPNETFFAAPTRVRLIAGPWTRA